MNVGVVKIDRERKTTRLHRFHHLTRTGRTAGMEKDFIVTVRNGKGDACGHGISL
jgi:hypothetical protein